MTTWRTFCDFSYDKPDPAALEAAGYDGVLMYLSRTPGKGMTADLAQQYREAGLAIIALYETTANAALGGHAAGVAQATEAVELAREVGYPAECPIIYALDADYSTDQMAGPVSAFVSGLHAVAGPDGEYGGIEQLRFLIAHGLADRGALFQTYAWSRGRWLSTADAPMQQYRNGQQVAGGTVDLCRVSPSLHVWEPTDMSLTDADVTKIWTLDGILDNRPWRADAKTNPKIQPGNAVEIAMDEAHAANLAATAAATKADMIITALTRLASPAAIAAAVVAALPPGISGTLTVADVQTAVQTVMSAAWAQRP